MKHFMNFEMGAMNVLTVPSDPAIAAEFAPLVSAGAPEPDFATIRPKWNSDMRWISANSVDTFRIFESAFDRLGIADHVAAYLDLEERPRLYNGFLLARSTCTDVNFHLDWADTGNEAFTFITPLDNASRGFGLVYEKVNGSIGEYDYRPGEGIVFGDRFRHSTKPGHSEQPVGMLCFQFGTDKMKHWDKIMETAGYQSLFICQPDGRFAVKSSELKTAPWRTLPTP